MNPGPTLALQRGIHDDVAEGLAELGWSVVLTDSPDLIVPLGIDSGVWQSDPPNKSGWFRVLLREPDKHAHNPEGVVWWDGDPSDAWTNHHWWDHRAVKFLPHPPEDTP